MEGSEDSQCYKIMYGNETFSMRNSGDVEINNIHIPTAKEETVLEFL